MADLSQISALLQAALSPTPSHLATAFAFPAPEPEDLDAALHALAHDQSLCTPQAVSWLLGCGANPSQTYTEEQWTTSVIGLLLTRDDTSAVRYLALLWGKGIELPDIALHLMAMSNRVPIPAAVLSAARHLSAYMTADERAEVIALLAGIRNTVEK